MNGTRRALSLFSGAGGLDLGVEAAGYDVAYAVENDATAVTTLNANRKRWFPQLAEVTPLDITALDPKAVMRDLGLGAGDLDLLVGGPPCVAVHASRRARWGCPHTSATTSTRNLARCIALVL